MPTTSNRIRKNRGKFELQITTALRTASAAAGSGLVIGDDGDWLVFSQDVNKFTPGSPSAKQVSEEYNASQNEAMIAVSENIPSHKPVLTLYEKNAAQESYGATADFNLKEEVFRIALNNNLELPIRYSPETGAVGDYLYTYTSCFVIGIKDPDVEPGATGSALYEVQLTAETKTTSVVA